MPTWFRAHCRNCAPPRTVEFPTAEERDAWFERHKQGGHNAVTDDPDLRSWPIGWTTIGG